MGNKKLNGIFYGSILVSSFYIGQFYCPSCRNCLPECEEIRNMQDAIKQEYSAGPMINYSVAGITGTPTTVTGSINF